MTTRAESIDAFLQANGWGTATQHHITGDASNRAYRRLTSTTDGCVILMDAPPDTNDSVQPFVNIAHHLNQIGLSAPRILALDAEKGLILLEDLGDDLFARVLQRQPDLEAPLYELATDVLVHLRNSPVAEGLTQYSPTFLAEMITPVFDWYSVGLDTDPAPFRDQAVSIFQDVLTRVLTGPACLSLRDYHAENLIWLPDRSGPARAGLLDFQDAFLGHPAYDLASLLKDARRDVPEDIEAAMIQRYVSATGVDEAEFRAAYHALGAQRNLRIIGIFARLCMHAGRTRYLGFLPRLWRYLLRDLATPGLESLQDLLRRALPELSSENLRKLSEKCGQYPDP